MKTLALAVFAFAVASPTYAGVPTAPLGAGASSLIVPAAQGCGQGRYRGPYGSCHRYGTGPYPGGFYGRPGHYCWRGPNGARHCK
ncbi:GCG_CRPN prefix-to-repeats domain-containing protein [Labrys okinawensis]|uniref:GCG_CRPN prefix-to-repeats domain-containing protein n=1 Tax=Labrys okinawensis TaxID=346911 RepID=UPI0039BC6224